MPEPTVGRSGASQNWRSERPGRRAAFGDGPESERSGVLSPAGKHHAPAAVPELTKLGRYLKGTGTKIRWLAKEIGIAPSTVSRWAWGPGTCMRPEEREAVLSVLRRRAALSLDGLLEDQREQLPLGMARHLQLRERVPGA